MRVCATESLLCSLKGLINNKDAFVDVSFLVGDSKDQKEIWAHKAILAARSPIFDQLFKRPSPHSGFISFSEISPEVFIEMLNYIYCGTVEVTSENGNIVLRPGRWYG